MDESLRAFQAAGERGESECPRVARSGENCDVQRDDGRLRRASGQQAETSVARLPGRWLPFLCAQFSRPDSGRGAYERLCYGPGAAGIS